MKKTQLKNLREKIKAIIDQELQLRVELKGLYDQAVVDAKCDKIALRYVRYAYFEAQKERLQKIINDRLEFHPFFTANPHEQDNN
jgi:hypothetical protein